MDPTKGSGFVGSVQSYVSQGVGKVKSFWDHKTTKGLNPKSTAAATLVKIKDWAVGVGDKISGQSEMRKDAGEALKSAAFEGKKAHEAHKASEAEKALKAKSESNQALIHEMSLVSLEASGVLSNVKNQNEAEKQLGDQPGSFLVWRKPGDHPSILKITYRGLQGTAITHTLEPGENVKAAMDKLKQNQIDTFKRDPAEIAAFKDNFRIRSGWGLWGTSATYDGEMLMDREGKGVHEKIVVVERVGENVKRHDLTQMSRTELEEFKPKYREALKKCIINKETLAIRRQFHERTGYSLDILATEHEALQQVGPAPNNSFRYCKDQGELAIVLKDDYGYTQTYFPTRMSPQQRAELKQKMQKALSIQ